MAHSHQRRAALPATRPDNHYRQHDHRHFAPTPPRNMGEHPGDNGHRVSRHTISAADLDDVESRAHRESEYTHDVDPDAWKLLVVCELGGQTRGGGVEHMGRILSYGKLAGLSFGYGDLF